MVFEEDMSFDAALTALEDIDSGEWDPGRFCCWEEDDESDMK